MPQIVLEKLNNHSAYIVWEITEKIQELRPFCESPIPNFALPKRKLEWTVGRILVQNLCRLFNISFNAILNTPEGKPVLKGSNAHISISHSYPMVCALIHLQKPCGIDIETPKIQLLKIQKKILHFSELMYQNSLPHLCLIWCGKEVIFKILGSVANRFKDDISIQFLQENNLLGKIENGVIEKKFSLHYKKVNQYFVCYNI